jgi:hypothetical protein
MKRLLLTSVAALSIAPASALADTGSINSISPLGGTMYDASYTVNVTAPTDYGYYGGFGFAWQVSPSEPCDPATSDGRLTWVGNVLAADFPDTETGRDMFYAKTVPFKLCLGVSRASLGQWTVAEQVYGTPAPAPATPTAPTPPPGPVVQTAPSTDPGKAAVTCTYWMKQETKRERAYKKARNAFRKKRTKARRRAMRKTLAKFQTAERKALKACT